MKSCVGCDSIKINTNDAKVAQMWPSLSNVGPEVTYGLDGLPYYKLAKENGNEELCWSGNLWSYPKNCSERPLHKVKYSTKRVVGGNLVVDAGKADRYERDRLSKMIPSDLAVELMGESNNWNSRYIYDPTMSDLLVTSNLKRYRFVCPVVAFVTGEIGSLFNLAKWDSKQEELYTASLGNTKLDVPRMTSPVTVDVESPIKQIAFPEYELSTGVWSRFCAVRTDRKVFIFKPIASKESLKLELVGSVDCNDLHGFSFSDVALNPYDPQQFVTVDIKGNWQVWLIREMYAVTIVEFASGNAPSLKTVSHWRKLIWGAASSELLMFDRSSARRIMYNDGTPTDISKEFQNPYIATHFLHVSKCPDEPNEMFVLTSEKLIWTAFDSTGAPKTMLSWRHFLDLEDPSLRFSLNPIQENHGRKYLVIVNSITHSVSFFYQFHYDPKLNSYTMPCDPFYIKVSSSSTVCDTLLLPVHLLGSTGQPENKDEKFFAFYILSSAFDITRTLLSSGSHAVIYKYRFNVANEIVSQERKFLHDTISKGMANKAISRSYFFELFSSKNSVALAKIYDTLFKDVYSLVEGDVQNVDNESIDQPVERDITDLPSLVRQAQSVYSELDVVQKQRLQFIMSELFHISELNYNELPEHLIKLLIHALAASLNSNSSHSTAWETEINKNCIANFITNLLNYLIQTESLVFYQKSAVRGLNHENSQVNARELRLLPKEDLNPDTALILNDWPDPIVSQDNVENDVMTLGSLNEPTQADLPSSVSSSQVQVKKRRSKQQLSKSQPTPLTGLSQSFTDLQAATQPVPSISDKRGRNGKPKKKKKKKGGFA